MYRSGDHRERGYNSVPLSFRFNSNGSSPVMFGALDEPMTYRPSLNRHRATPMLPAFFIPTSYRPHSSDRAYPPQGTAPGFAAVRIPSPGNLGNWPLQGASDDYEEEASGAAHLSVVIPQLRGEVVKILQTFKEGPVKDFGDRVTAKGKQERGEIIDPLWKKVVEVACREDHVIAERISDAKDNLNGKLNRVKKAPRASQASENEQGIVEKAFLYSMLDKILRSGDVCVELVDKAKHEWSACEMLMVELEELKRILAENGPYRRWLPRKKSAAKNAAKNAARSDNVDGEAAQGESSGNGSGSNGW